ncbi:MAG: TerB family tellurite resistance protein [Rhodothermales bacterium]
MPTIDDRAQLRRLAFLYLWTAHRSDNYLSDAEVESVTQRLAGRSPYGDSSEIRRIVMEALDEYLEADDADVDARSAASQLGKSLERDQKVDILEDLRQIAEADGVLLRAEKEMLRSIAEVWGISPASATAVGGAGEWGVLHDLAYIYLVLAHSTDYDLSETEMQVMFNKLREWQPEIAAADVKDVLSSALGAYAEGEDNNRLEMAVQSVRRSLPREQRMAALNDLVTIANADGVFLDDEEDLINHLLTEWDVDPYANYGRHGSKE